MKKEFEVNTETGELKVFTESGYFLVKPYGEGVSVELFDKNIANGYKEEKNELSSVDLTIVEKDEDRYVTHVWSNTSEEGPSETIEHEIQFNN